VARLSEYRRIEWLLARRPDHLYAIAYTGGLSILTAFALPHMPSVIPRFFQRTLQLGTWADIALFNLYAATYVITLLVGTLDLLRVWILPVEEGYMSLYMSKPIRPSEYLRARLSPILANAVFIGLASQAAAGLAVWHLIGPFDRAQFIHSSGLIIGLILFLLCLFNYLFLYLSESYYAVVLSLAVWTITLGPTSLFIYRPELFSPAARAALVFPANLLWHQSTVLAHEGILLTCLLSGSVLFLGLARLKLGRAPLG
jgi:hypothetical protein